MVRIEDRLGMGAPVGGRAVAVGGDFGWVLFGPRSGDVPLQGGGIGVGQDSRDRDDHADLGGTVGVVWVDLDDLASPSRDQFGGLGVGGGGRAGGFSRRQRGGVVVVEV